MENNTIAAVATPVGVGALSVIRMSGTLAESILEKIFTPYGKKANETHFLRYGVVFDMDDNKIDEVMAVFMKAPNTYTREDTVEIYCHGGINTTMAVLNLLYKNGAEPAQPGEFTKRAFLNGRIDLSQARAVMDLINAKTDTLRRASLRKLSGGLSDSIKEARDKVLQWLANVELSIDYPEHEEETMNLQTIHEEGQLLLAKLRQLSTTAKTGKYINNGIPTAIVGKPNVGKSSLMNTLLQENRSIVTDVPGTTRDTITELLILPVEGGEIPLLLTDTAGIRAIGDISEVEQIGIERSIENAKYAELALHIVDGSAAITDEDFAVAELLAVRKIVVVNKSDLSTGYAETDLSKLKGTAPAVFISAKDRTGLDTLYKLICEMFFGGVLSADSDIITNAEEAFSLNKAIKHLEMALSDIENDSTEDIVSINLTEAYNSLGKIIGETVEDDVLDKIFSEFCVGK
ncbi:MAG: tRNA uridine-5-carboxymethylaminomethyl(34) synthesis GTPase MnmE [Turicibacter sp.]|nr:tRNA uridine-5-carboxymethylaminomethyl(34) synthesis GTPase MnmE [Turicibacter sp.]